MKEHSFRFGVVGYGWAADMQARAATNAGHKVVGVSGPRQVPRDSFAAKYSCELSVDTVEELLEGGGLDALIVCSPNASHFLDARAAIEAGKHVLIEKPVTTSLADGELLRSAAKRKNVTVAVGHMWRYRREVVDLRDQICANKFGSIVRTHGYGVHAKWGPSGWFVKPELSGGGALIDMGVHAIDTVRFLLGDPLPIRVQASIGKGAFSDIEVDDDGLILIEWDNGVRSLIEFGWWQPELGGLEAETKVFGTTGVGQIWPDFQNFDKSYRHCDVPMYQAQIEDFVDACVNSREPDASIGVGIVALDVVMRAYESAQW